MPALRLVMPLLRAADWMRHRVRLRRWNTAHAWGRRGEDLAHRFLQQKGYLVVARNLRLRGARVELDVVARDGETIVFVEVKARSTDAFGTPEEAVDAEKREHVVRAALAYLHAAGAKREQARFDIVSVLFGGRTRIEHIRDAFGF
jgi:putative endonuclease